MNIKKDLFYIRKAFSEYQGFSYIYNKYFRAKKIYSKGIIEKPINNKDLSIHVLTSKADFTMLLWSLDSFYRQSSEIGQLYIHDDGTLTLKNINLIKKHLPSAIIVRQYDVFFRLEQFGGSIYRFRKKYPQYVLLKKLIDTYFYSAYKMHLIIDSDLYWFRKPIELETEIRNGAIKSLVMRNNTPCYVHFKKGKLSEEKAMINTGIVLYNKDNFNLKKLVDYLLNIDITNKANTHFIEQAGFASILENLTVLPENRYFIKGELSKETIVRHYTSPRRVNFFTEAIQEELEQIIWEDLTN